MFKPGWKMTLFTLLLSPLLFTLGQWQLEREQEKIQLQNEFDLRSKADEVALDSIDRARADLAFLKITANGRYLNDSVFLLDNKIHEGRVGYEVINPFLTESGTIVLVNRGWIPQGPTREQLPDIKFIADSVEIKGTIYVPLEEPFLLNNVEEAFVESGPVVIQSVDMERLSNALAKDLFPYTVRLSAGSPGLEQPNWQTVNMEPEKHRGYAVQWFTMLAALLSMYIYFGFKNPRLHRNRD